MPETLCAHCKRPVTGADVDFPNARDCEGFFGGTMKEGDAICFWCLEAWAVEVQDRTEHGHA